jgi:anthranilate synthase component 1
MTVFAPDLDTATELCARGQTVLLTATRVDDLETPVSAYLKLASHNANTFLLESVEGGAFRGRYSAIGLDPDLIWRCRGDQAEIAHAPAPGVAPGAFEPCADAPLHRVAQTDRREPTDTAVGPAAHLGGPVRLSGL